MRPIKFRAWNPNTNEMISWEQMGDDHWDLWTEFRACETMMQYVGLKDKNGKEIYEGDIINCLHPLSRAFVPYGVVSFKNGCFKFDYLNDPWHLFTASEIEIMGNIYENPNLLK